jgi:hypothetical protein
MFYIYIHICMYMLAHTLCINVYVNLSDIMGRSEVASQMQVFALEPSLRKEVIQGRGETRRDETRRDETRRDENSHKQLMRKAAA